MTRIDNMLDKQREQILLEARNTIKQRAKRMIWVNFQKEGVHMYPAALTDPKLKTGDQYDVSFLGNLHRHMFHFNVAIEVEHSDRAIEFIQFKRWLESLYSSNTLQLNYKSCEMMAEDLYDTIATRYPNRDIQITVSEDGENGATLTFTAS